MADIAKRRARTQVIKTPGPKEIHDSKIEARRIGHIDINSCLRGLPVPGIRMRVFANECPSMEHVPPIPDGIEFGRKIQQDIAALVLANR